MKFRLDHNPPKNPVEISHRHKLFLGGSCFAENIGRLLTDHRFNCSINPGGITFDPCSIAGNLKAALREEPHPPEMIVQRGGRFFSYLHHSSISDSSEQAFADLLAETQKKTKEALVTADFVFISLGTAFAFVLTSKKAVVANCHKQPSSLFQKKLLPVEEVVQTLAQLLTLLEKLNPACHVILTVSPVKYLKDGIVNNSISKATLLLAAHQVVSKYQNCWYFPSYELVTDDLRDYRFYQEDLAHPNAMAIDYVWEKFGQTYFSQHTLKLNSEIARLNLSLSHRTLHQHPEEAEKLQASIGKQMALIRSLDPAISL